MGERTAYTPGTFSWTDLTTTDQDGAKAFYTELFGWEADDNPVGEGMVYSMMIVGGKPVAAISPQPQQQREMGAPADLELVRHGREMRTRRGAGEGARRHRARAARST